MFSVEEIEDTSTAVFNFSRRLQEERLKSWYLLLKIYSKSTAD